MPEISVLMSTYNETEKEMRESIESILNQTFEDFELIIISDNPKNQLINTVVREYKDNDSRIKFFINKENIGLAESLNIAASNASGRYLLRMDADDICVLNRFEKQLKVISEGDYDLVCSNYYFIDEFGKRIERPVEWYDSYSLRTLLKKRNVIHHPTVIMKADSFRKLNGYRNFKSAQDYDLWLRMLNEGYSFFMMKEKLIYYRVRPESTTIRKRYQQAATIEYIKNIHSKVRKKGKDEYDYFQYLDFLKSKKVDDLEASNDYNENFKKYLHAKQNIKEFRLIKGVYGLLKVILGSKYFRPRIIKNAYYTVLKNVLRTKYLIKEKRRNS